MYVGWNICTFKKLGNNRVRNNRLKNHLIHSKKLSSLMHMV